MDGLKFQDFSVYVNRFKNLYILYTHYRINILVRMDSDIYTCGKYIQNSKQ